MQNDPKVLIALDFNDAETALSFVSELDASQCRLKVGKELFTSFGPQFVQRLIDQGFDVFLDLKFHDIPNTVAKAVAAAADLGVWMVNVHAGGGSRMMKAAAEALKPYGDKAPLLIAVTMLTSMEEGELAEMGVTRSAEEHVLSLARLAQASGLDGVVCSAREASLLKSELGKEFKLVTPGIRPAGSDKGDQKRVMTPAEAVAAGSDYLVIGRPITQADSPLQALVAINATL
ncbi:orotidine-5'-phosphate decarboxylase [Ferrimonas sediminicola]|uniref:Orotidine 5'-phosphate decarboxylase n=1 Tax=Ferrimonas sediminicola TaxID=2569538 RepID=A0A4U1BH73_9GAMM|nr:orotidine-5'-phosphate decarboxylase [Ferrimonas sediminicola]TKB50394.1 orotidine-5'-phosphate decarboxylase [Ferrimonas sediminicola]